MAATLLYAKQELVATAPNRVGSWHKERHEALLNPAVMKGHRERPVVAGRWKLEGNLTRETPGRVGSSPDNDGMGQHCQIAQVRQVRREGVRKEPASERSSSANHRLETGRLGAGLQRRPARRKSGGKLAGRSDVAGQGGHGEGLRRTRGEVAGA